MRKLNLSKSTFALISGLLAACLSCARSSHPTIAFISQTTAVGLWEPARAGSLEATMKTQYSIHWVGPTAVNDIQGQLDLLDEAVSRRSAGIILAPNHPLSLMTTVRKAVLLGIPTVVISSPLPLAASNRLFYVLNDEEEEGKIAARRIGLRLNGKGSVAILGLNSDNNDLLSRMRSFETTLTLEFPHIMIHSRHLESSSEAQAEQIAHGLLAGERIPDAIVALTATATTGAVRAIEDDSLRKRIVLVSCDQNYESLYSLSLGKVDSIVAENTFAMGYQAAQLILAAKSGSLETGTYYVKPVLVTRDNMYSPQLFHILTYDTRALY